MISYKKIGKILIGPAILLIKTLQGAGKILATVFVKLFSFSAWLLRPFLWRPFIKLYGQYLLSLKNVREIKRDHGLKMVWLKKYAAPGLMIVLTISISSYNLSLGGGNFNISEKMSQAVVSSLIKNEFGQAVGVNEFVKEKAGNFSEITGVQDKYPTGALKALISIHTNTETPKNNTNFSWLQNNYIFIPNKVTVNNTGNSTTNTVNTESRSQVIQYTVMAGDSISSIAKKFGITINTVLWANNLTARGVIRQGNQLTILPQSGIIHKVSSGESLKLITRKYGVDEDKIIAANNIGNAGLLKIGQQLIIPGGQKISTAAATVTNSNTTKPTSQTNTPKPGDATVSSTKLQWPTVGYRITQYYSWKHTGLDIANKTGTPLYASENGTVEVSGWNSGGYGYQVLINHGNGIKTRYAHASKLYVVAGQKVSRGETIAAMGSTGRSTGPHIHYEVIINGVRVNPLNYIR